MQVSKNDNIIDAAVGNLSNLTKEAKKVLSSGKADKVTIANIKKNDVFEVKGLRFRIIKKFRRGRFMAKLIGI